VLFINEIHVTLHLLNLRRMLCYDKRNVAFDLQ